MNQAGNQSALFDYYGKPSFSQAFPLAMQHVVALLRRTGGVRTPRHYRIRSSRAQSH